MINKLIEDKQEVKIEFLNENRTTEGIVTDIDTKLGLIKLKKFNKPNNLMYEYIIPLAAIAKIEPVIKNTR